MREGAGGRWNHRTYVRLGVTREERDRSQRLCFLWGWVVSHFLKWKDQGATELGRKGWVWGILKWGCLGSWINRARLETEMWAWRGGQWGEGNSGGEGRSVRRGTGQEMLD